MDIYRNLAIRTIINRDCPGILDNDTAFVKSASLEEFWKGAEEVFEKHANTNDPGNWDRLRGAWSQFADKSNIGDWGMGAGVGGGLGLLYALATMSRDRGTLGNLLRSLVYGALGAGVGGLGHLGYSSWVQGGSGPREEPSKKEWSQESPPLPINRPPEGGSRTPEQIAEDREALDALRKETDFTEGTRIRDHFWDSIPSLGDAWRGLWGNKPILDAEDL